jgi:hypothetical protein
MDFYKGFICAQVFIFVVYITMGIVVYSFQGTIFDNLSSRPRLLATCQNLFGRRLVMSSCGIDKTLGLSVC